MPLTLSMLGMKRNRIYETIVSTYDCNGKTTAAPMGLIALDANTFLIRPYMSSSVYENIHETGCGVVNITTSPELFYRTTFKNEKRHLVVPKKWFIQAKTVHAPRIKSAAAYIEFVVKRLEYENHDRARFTCKSTLVEARKSFPQAYCRSTYALIECLIHATRIKVFLSDGRRGEAEKLIKLVEQYKQLTDRVAPGSKDLQVMIEILNHINRWRKTCASPR